MHVHIVARVVNAKCTIVNFTMKLVNPHVIFNFYIKSLSDHGSEIGIFVVTRFLGVFVKLCDFNPYIVGLLTCSDFFTNVGQYDTG